MGKYVLIIFGFFALLFASCSSGIRMTSSWDNGVDRKTTKHIKKILVVGLFGPHSKTLRKQMEEDMATDLHRLGYDAVTSYHEYGANAFVNIPEDKAMAIVNNNYTTQYDGVIIVTIVDKNSHQSYVPGYYNYPYYGGWGGGWGGWGYSPYYSPYSRGYYETDTHYSFEANFYDLHSKKILYSGQSDVANPSSPNNLAIDYSRVILRDMRRKNVLS